jgi:hypothetical protein
MTACNPDRSGIGEPQKEVTPRREIRRVAFKTRRRSSWVRTRLGSTSRKIGAGDAGGDAGDAGRRV